MARRILESKFSWILTLIPGLNLLYVWFLLMYKQNVSYYKALILLAVGAAIFQLNRILPDPWGFVPLYLVTILLSAASYISLKKSNIQDWNVSRKKRIALIVLAAGLAFLFGMSVFIERKADLDTRTANALTAIVENDTAGFQAEMYNRKRSLQDYIDSLSEEGILLSGTVQKQRRNTFQSTQKGRTQLIEAEYEYLIGGIPYTLCVVYLSDEHSSGFTTFTITRRE